MARISFKADKGSESVGGGSGNKFAAKVRGFYTLQICEVSNGKLTSDTAKNPKTPMTNFRLEVADDDSRDQLGAHVYHNVTWIPRGTEEKAKPGHGMAVHWLHACHMPFDGQFSFDEDDFLKAEHAMVHVLLEVEPYKTVKGGRTYNNEKYVIREVYTEDHPQPDTLPEPPKPKAAYDPATRTPVGAVAAASTGPDVGF